MLTALCLNETTKREGSVTVKRLKYRNASGSTAVGRCTELALQICNGSAERL